MVCRRSFPLLEQRRTYATCLLSTARFLNGDAYRQWLYDSSVPPVPALKPPPSLRLASTLFHHFIAADDASENLSGLKRLHGLMPYFVLKGILKISNPVAMIRGWCTNGGLSLADLVCVGVLDLFLAQPFGGRSLLQR